MTLIGSLVNLARERMSELANETGIDVADLSEASFLSRDFMNRYVPMHFPGGGR